MATYDIREALNRLLGLNLGGEGPLTAADLAAIQPGAMQLGQAITPEVLAALSYVGGEEARGQVSDAYSRALEIMQQAATGEDPLTAAATAAVQQGLAGPPAAPPGLFTPEVAGQIGGLAREGVEAQYGHLARSLRDLVQSRQIGSGEYTSLLGELGRQRIADINAAQREPDIQQALAAQQAALETQRLNVGNREAMIAAANQLAGQRFGQAASLADLLANAPVQGSDYDELLAQMGGGGMQSGLQAATTAGLGGLAAAAAGQGQLPLRDAMLAPPGSSKTTHRFTGRYGWLKWTGDRWEPSSNPYGRDQIRQFAGAPAGPGLSAAERIAAQRRTAASRGAVEAPGWYGAGVSATNPNVVRQPQQPAWQRQAQEMLRREAWTREKRRELGLPMAPMSTSRQRQVNRSAW